jgi:crotonobetainyl-CoA:carnitine CoA-transferase CaiB-like acyl-CoA transferase
MSEADGMGGASGVDGTDVLGAGALAGLRVLDLSTGVAGQYCGKLLAGYGADCVLAEPPGGTATRSLAPLLTGGDPRQRSVFFRHLNQGKHSLVAAPGDPQRQALARAADVIIRDQGTLLPPVAPDTAVECVIGEFPAGGPYERWQGGEMVHQALSGAMYMTGRPDRQPLYGVGHRGYYACGTTAFTSVLAALHERAGSGRGQQVTATVFESCAAVGQNLVSQYSYNGSYENRSVYPGFLAMLRCRDDWMVLFAIRYWEQLCAVFGLPELAADERLARQADRLEHWPEVVEQLQRRAAGMAAADLVAALQRARISSEVIAPLASLIASPQWQARRVVRTARAGGRAETALGPPFSVGDSGYHAIVPSPVLAAAEQGGSSAWDILERWAAVAPAAGPDHSAGDPASAGRADPTGAGPAGATATGTGPLAGLRVVDMTTAWAGPFAARSLAWLGAEVIKIDAPSHPDSWRGAAEGGAARHYPGGQPGRRPWNRCVLFNTQGQGKWSLGLDLKVAGAREVMLELARVTDILVANFTPGVLERLGIGYADLSAVNPQIIVVEMPALGPGGPDSKHQGMGKTMEAATGMASLMGYGDGVPALTGPAYLDPIGGLNAAAAALTALQYRQRTGRGCRAEVPQTEAGANWIGEFIQQQAETGRSWQADGNAVADAAPHDAYPCRGDDEWVVIAVETAAHWRALAGLLGRPDLAQAPGLAEVGPRAARRAELDALIGAWTCDQAKYDAARRLQEAGVPAAPVCSGADVGSDPGLLASGLIRELTHQEAGRHAYPGLAYRLARTPGGVTAAAPCFGEQNDLVLRELLGLPADRIAELWRTGAVSDHPAGARPAAATTSGGAR